METPEEENFALQPNPISRSIYSCSVNARKLLLYAQYLLHFNEPGDYVVRIKIRDFLKDLKIPEGSYTRKAVREAFEEATDTSIRIGDSELLSEYIKYPWFIESKVMPGTLNETHLPDTWEEWLRQSENQTMLTKQSDNSRLNSIHWGLEGVIQMEFNSRLAEVLKDYGDGNTKLLLGMSQLQSFYAWKLYEIAFSWSGFAGKNGNPKDHWWFKMTLSRIRLLLNIDPKKYKLKKEFRRNVIDYPCAEINKLNCGLRITPEYERSGIYLVGVKFHCENIEKNMRNITPATETEKEDNKLIEAHQEEYNKYVDEELKRELNFGSPDVQQHVAESRALNRLIEVHKSTKRGRGRPAGSKNKPKVNI